MSKSPVLRIILVVGTLLAVFFTMPSASARGVQSSGRVSGEAERHLESAAADDLIPIIVQTVSNPSGAHLVRLAAHGGLLKARYSVIHGYSAKIRASQLEDFANDPEVVHISYDTLVRSHLDVAYPAVKADIAYKDFGLDGSGVGVAVVDTGIAWHPDLVRTGTNNTNITEIEIVGHEGGLADYYGHGTHVAGIIAGNGASSSSVNSYRTFKGIAPNVKLYSIRALYPNGTGYTSDIISGINWAVQYQRQYNIRVMNLSLGHPVYESYPNDPLCLAVRAAYNAGIAVVVAAGNNGAVGTGFGTIDSPGNEPSAITVGAMDDSRTVTTTDDVLAWYSSKGPTLIDHVVKPDLVAPGTTIVSLRDAGSYLDTTYHQFTLTLGSYSYPTNSTQDGVYYSLSGTSMAAPFVTGAAALMAQKDPTLNPATIKARLMASAVKDTQLIFQTGAGELDVDAALKATGTVSSAMSPPSTLTSKGDIYVQDLSLIWGGSWNLASVYGSLKGSSYGVKMASSTLSLIWGGSGVLCGSSSLIWNNAITTSGLIWGCDASSLIWTNGMVTNDAGVWGGGGHH